jgi:hypothetical protein
LLRTREQLALFVVAAVALDLRLIGDDNTWDWSHIVVSDLDRDKTKTD